MTSQTTHTLHERPPMRFGLTMLHLGAMGAVGSGILGIFAGALAAGLGTLVLLGFGLIILVGLLYAIWGAAWFETERVSALYRLDAASLSMPQRQKPGFGGWIHSLWLILKSGRMWAAFGSFVAASFIGALMIGVLQLSVRLIMASGLVVFARSTFLTDLPLWGSVGVVLGAILLGVGALFGAAALHRMATVAIISAISREKHLTEQVHQTRIEREGAVRSAEVERARIERDLHDGVQPRLVSIGMTLGLAKQQIETEPTQARELVDEAHLSTQHAITELRQLTRGIYASVLDDRGLDAALSAVAARSHIPVHLDVRVTEAISKDAETATYFAIAEALTNVTKHSHASQSRVLVRVRHDAAGPHLWARVEDDGVGGARVTPGGGLDGIVGRITAAGGTLTVDSPRGGPTTLEMSTPCAS
ncbi:MAG: sensor histidine kinase [Canibacter sp.]